MSTRLVASFLLLLLAASTVSAAPPELTPTEEANYIAIDGWWTQCGNVDSAIVDSPLCKGDLQQSSNDPSPIDVTGETCYINPRVRGIQGVEHLIYWFATSSGDNQIGVYSWYLPFADVETYYPAEEDCTDGGACICNPAFDALRSGYGGGACFGANATVAPDSHDCLVNFFQPPSIFLTPGECAVDEDMSRIYKEEDDGGITNFTINACVLPARFVSMAPSTAPTLAPTTATAPTAPEPTETSNGMVLATSKIVWILPVVAALALGIS